MKGLGVWYDHDGSPLTSAEWIAKTSVAGYTRVAETTVGARRVSTVLLGLDHGFGRGLEIFETMTFPDQSICERYATRADAERGHAVVVAQCEAERKAIQ